MAEEEKKKRERAPREEVIYKITLADGTEITDLRLNGNNYISKEDLDESLFDGNLYKVTINYTHFGEEVTQEYSDMELIALRKYEEETWFILREIPYDEKMRNKILADIDYLAMMTGTDL